ATARREANYEQGQTKHHNDARRLRRWAEPEPRGPARRRRRTYAYVDVHAEDVPRTERRGGRQDGDRRRRPERDVCERRCCNHGAEHVLWRGPRGPVEGRRMEGVVGRQSALPYACLRSHPPPTRASANGGWHNFPLRNRRHRVSRSEEHTSELQSLTNLLCTFVL